MGRPQKTLEPLAEAPEWTSEFFEGTCGTCTRPMVRNHYVSLHPELGRWYVRGAGGCCVSCSLAKMREARRRRSPAPWVVSLRVMIGACPECGWAEDGDETDHHWERGCSLAPSRVGSDPTNHNEGVPA